MLKLFIAAEHAILGITTKPIQEKKNTNTKWSATASHQNLGLDP